MSKRIRIVRDHLRHRSIVRSHPLARIPEGVFIGMDVYHSLPGGAGQAGTGGSRNLVGAA